MTLARILTPVLTALLLAGTAAAATPDPERARELFDALGCRGCHRLGDSGGNFGPPLDGVGKRLDRAQIHLRLTTPKDVDPASLMPSFGHLAGEDLDALTDYLRGLR